MFTWGKELRLFTAFIILVVIFGISVIPFGLANLLIEEETVGAGRWVKGFCLLLYTLVTVLIGLWAGPGQLLAYGKIKLSLRSLFVLIAWCALGFALFGTSADDIARINYKESVRSFTGNGNIFSSSFSLARAYNHSLSIAHAVLSDIEPTTPPRIVRTVLNGFKAESVPVVAEHIDQISTAARATAKTAQQLPLRSAAAQNLRRQQALQTQLLGQIAQAVQPVCKLVIPTEPDASYDWRSQLEQLEQAEAALVKTLDKIEASPAFPALAQTRPLAESLRLAAFDLQRWPGFTTQQLADIQQHIDRQPACALLLLIDHAICNAQAKLADAGDASSEPYARARLAKSEYIAELLALVPPDTAKIK